MDVFDQISKNFEKATKICTAIFSSVDIQDINNILNEVSIYDILYCLFPYKTDSSKIYDVNIFKYPINGGFINFCSNFTILGIKSCNLDPNLLLVANSDIIIGIHKESLFAAIASNLKCFKTPYMVIDETELQSMYYCPKFPYSMINRHKLNLSDLCFYNDIFVVKQDSTLFLKYIDNDTYINLPFKIDIININKDTFTQNLGNRNYEIIYDNLYIYFDDQELNNIILRYNNDIHFNIIDYFANNS